jgi:nitroreductase
MTLLEAINQRRSRRKYLSVPLDAIVAERLQGLIGEYNKTDGVDMRLVLNNGTAFAGLRKSYGMLAGVQNYIGLIDRVADPENPSKYRASVNTEKMGYYGELVVLHAATLGLGTCWVGGSFDRRLTPFELADGEMVACTITLGLVPEVMSLREKVIRGATHRKTKTVEEMYDADTPVPDWFLSGMQAVQKAPSAVNRQPVHFYYRRGEVAAAVPNPADIGSAFDLGIAKLHFEIGAGGGMWAFGNGAAFKYSGAL